MRLEMPSEGEMPFWLLLAAGLVLILDQVTKGLVACHLAEGQSAYAASWIRIRRMTNPRGGLLLHKPWALFIVWPGLFVGILLTVRQGWFFQRCIAQVALGMALGGACSNIYDQIRRGAVTDFIDLGWWPVFNLSDVAITAGAITALCFIR